MSHYILSSVYHTVMLVIRLLKGSSLSSIKEMSSSTAQMNIGKTPKGGRKNWIRREFTTLDAVLVEGISRHDTVHLAPLAAAKKH